jgi:hypothetical protein
MALLRSSVVFGQCFTEQMRCVLSERKVSCAVEAVALRWPEIGVRTAFDDLFDVPLRGQSAQVREACSVTITPTSCSVWSMWETIGTIVEIAPPFAFDGVMKIENVGVAREISETGRHPSARPAHLYLQASPTSASRVT